MTEQELQAYVTELKKWEGHEPVAKKKFNEIFSQLAMEIMDNMSRKERYRQKKKAQQT